MALILQKSVMETEQLADNKDMLFRQKHLSAENTVYGSI